MEDSAGNIRQKIKSFQRKYYLNLFLRGCILTLSILGGYFIVASLLEHSLWMSQWMRLLVLLTFFAVAGYCLFRFLMDPLKWWIANKGLSEEETARLIGRSIPDVKDRLVNLIQLTTLSDRSALGYASVQQKSREFEPMEFSTVIDLTRNTRYLRYLFLPVILFAVIFFINSSILTSSTDRLVHFNREYSPEAPFNFTIVNKSLAGFYNEDYKLEIKLEGNAVPESAYLILNGQRLKLASAEAGNFSYTFERLQEPIEFQIEAAGFYSDPFAIKLLNRPELLKSAVELLYPRYLQRQNDRLTNVGNLEVPEGTIVRWKISTAYADDASMLFAAEGPEIPFHESDNQSFVIEKTFKDPGGYEIVLSNENSKNKERIAYQVEVVKDEYPQIAVNNFRDSVLYQRIILGGTVGDDHGVTKLKLNYQISDESGNQIVSKSVPIPVQRNQIQQNFFFNWSLDSLTLSPGQRIEYHLQVWDNDGVNGSKSTKSSQYTFMVPTDETLEAEISKSQQQTEKNIDQSFSKAKKLQDQIENASQKIKGKQTLDWQDKKMLEDIIQQKQSLDEAVEQLKNENKLLDEKKDSFTEQNDRIKEKAEQIQKLMDQLLDEETKKLFEELQKLLKENTDVSKLQKLLDKMNQNSDNLEKELERTLELFKELQYEFKLDQAINDLKEQIEKQEDLLEKTESLEQNKDNKKQEKNDGQNSEAEKKSEELAKQQEKLAEEMKKTGEELQELNKLGEELNKDEQMPSNEQQQEIQQEQNESKEQLEQNQPSKAVPPQKKALQKLQQMKDQMEGMQNAMTMEMDMQNLESLRQIIHGLVKLSYDQEGLMKEFNELQQNDPRFNVLAQTQLKLKDDSRVIEDSLLALGKKDPMMGSFITREIGELNSHMNKVIEANKDRRRPQAATAMQMSMTSMNNLALMLDDHFDMMMQMMANAKPSAGKSKQKSQKPSLSQMQQQLNERIQQLKSSGKSGRELSEELAKMAAEQERIRKALQEMQEKMKNEGKTPGGDIPGKMEQTEMDLVNKQLTDQLIKRQKEIMTRLLEAEKSMREQDMDEERKGETAKEQEKEIPKAFEEYLRLKEKEVELLKTVPPKLYPYYKKEVSEYFKRLGNN